MKPQVRRPTVILVLLVLALAAISPRAAGVTRVLFIGNSYTFFNNLPEVFARLAEAGKQGPVETAMVASGGFRLQDYLETGAALKTLHQQKWNFVVLQEQSTLGVNAMVDGKPRVTSDRVFAPAAATWTAEIHKAGATPVFYLTWARKATPQDQAILTEAYEKAARAGGGMLAPVGKAWARVRQERPDIELFQDDGSHPLPSGTYLAACTFYATIFGKTPVGLPSKISGVPVNLETGLPEPGKSAVLVNLTGEQAAVLQGAAWSAWQETKKATAGQH